MLLLLRTAEALANPWRIVPGERTATNTFLDDFKRQKEFADVWEDTEFIAVVAP